MSKRQQRPIPVVLLSNPKHPHCQDIYIGKKASTYIQDGFHEKATIANVIKFVFQALKVFIVGKQDNNRGKQPKMMAYPLTTSFRWNPINAPAPKIESNKVTNGPRQKKMT